ncbi:uncharacterized protein LOC116017910 [Ipomoea triloba]|uniref:uncharacterized protein LOC116017639 n=1 Tax=Ipomoea triloba TaxID=35885 RepID=UPI00125D0BD7|nr:uncharacterized protein LOC116017639 [Ipomoea triloba]XP_031114440.1 uncharacterized protein LOC116017910 [Ipomoea triloba]
MGSEFLSRKPHYDITMSKRTRKPASNVINIQESAENCISGTVKMNQVVNEVCDDHEGIIQGDDDDSDRSKKSLKQLIEGGRRGTSLGEYFTAEEKQLQVAVVAAEDGGSNGVKFKRMVRRYTKVLSHMMKLKRDANKPHFRLKL